MLIEGIGHLTGHAPIVVRYLQQRRARSILLVHP